LSNAFGRGKTKITKQCIFLKYVTLQKTLVDVMKPYYLKAKETQLLVGIITVCSLDLPTIEYQL